MQVWFCWVTERVTRFQGCSGNGVAHRKCKWKDVG